MNDADPRGWNYRAVVLAKLRRLEEALVSVEKALTLQPKSPIYWWTKTRIYEVQGRWSDAAFCLEHVLEYDPNDKTASHLLVELRQYRDQPSWDTASRELDAFLSSFKVKVSDMTRGQSNELLLLRQERDSMLKKIEVRVR
jgi:tetratricopeptide (TPR) repeat protein